MTLGRDGERARGDTITVVVPTYRRPDDLQRCLQALKNQTRPAEVVLIVARAEDAAAWAVIAQFESALPLRGICVSAPGQVNALNAGLDAVTTDFVAITDDDAAPWPQWLERILVHFRADASVGGVGGRDHMYFAGTLLDGRERVVGRISRFGKHVGNHHLGFGPPREVDVLKGANMSYRMAAVAGRRFDVRLRGAGAQVHNDMAFSLTLRRAGWKLIYDPEVAIDHFPAQRFDEDGRESFNAVATANMAFNETVVRLELMPLIYRVPYLAWALAVGTRASPGVVQLARFLRRDPQIAAKRFAATVRGRLEGAHAAFFG